MKIIFATNNKHKLDEVQAVLGAEYTLVTPKELGIAEDIPETATTLEGNALLKAQYLHERTKENCFADDTGLEVKALDGAPGVYSARYAGTAHDSQANMALLLENMKNEENRKARFRTVISLIIDGEEHLFEGIVNGTITREVHGDGGFGYDPIFMPDGFDTTFAQMSPKQKNSISHRGRAVARLGTFLKARLNDNISESSKEGNKVDSSNLNEL